MEYNQKKKLVNEPNTKSSNQIQSRHKLGKKIRDQDNLNLVEYKKTKINHCKITG